MIFITNKYISNINQTFILKRTRSSPSSKYSKKANL